jgi:hypothetical protein
MTEKDTRPLTAQDLFIVLSENIQRLRNNEVTPAAANAVVNSTAGMLRIVKLQMEYARMTGKTPEIPLLTSGQS